MNQGVLKGFDQATNIILDESHERVFSTKVSFCFLSISSEFFPFITQSNGCKHYSLLLLAGL